MDTSQSNPYSPPESDELATSLLLPGETGRSKQRRNAIVIFTFSVGISVLFAIVDDMIVETRIGAWPIVFTTAIVSLLSSFITHDRIFAPLSCFAAIMCSCIVVSITHDIAHAQLHLALPIACAFSVPSLLIASWLGKN